MLCFLECKPIDVPVGRRLLGNVLSVDSSAALACDAGFVPDITVVTCTADGTWKPPLSACVIGISNCLSKVYIKLGVLSISIYII